MAESLREQLLKSGIVKQVREENRAKPKPASPGRKRQRKPVAQEGDIDLAKAYALRAQREVQERKHAEQAAAEQARLKRERKAKVQQLLEGQALNRADAEHPRHFEYHGRIRRVYVDQAQLVAINAGELAVVQHNGRYLVVERSVADAVHAVEPALLALRVDPSSPKVEDGVPDDLVW